MDLKKSFNPSTWLRAGEMSILSPLLMVYTIVYLVLMIYDFAARGAFTLPGGMMIVYLG